MTPPRTGIDRHRNERAAPALAGMHAPKGRALRKLAWIFACTGLTSALVLLVLSSVTHAACGHDGAGFDAWLAQFRQRAALQGISPTTISSALAGITYDPTVVRLDRSQKSFKLSFEQFYARRVGPGLMRRGQSLMRQHQVTLDRIEQHFGVPGPILIAIWGLETNYGADSSGKYSIIRSVATLAYDCRRSEFFTEHLLDALRILDRGDLTLVQLRGGWAGEIGHTQFLPSGYYKYAVDFDGDGRRDLERSVPDMLASTANFLKGNGWQAGQSWEPGSANYAVLREWNRAEVYQRTIAVMAMKLREGP
jgi:lytic murein transglycosylase